MGRSEWRGKAQENMAREGGRVSVSATEVGKSSSLIERREIVDAFPAFKTLLQSFARLVFLSDLVADPIEVHSPAFGML